MGPVGSAATGACEGAHGASALARTRYVAAWLVRLGAVGYAAILAALPLALFTDVSLERFPGLLLYVPGAAFEVLLPVLLIVRGLHRTPRKEEVTS